MSKPRFTITVSRINESANKAPYETMAAESVVMSEDGTLTIKGDGRSHSFTSGTYDGFEVKRAM
jgi:hypothetical protein